MPDLERALGLAESNFAYKRGAFYGAPDGLALGVGLIYDNIAFPLYDENEHLFDTVSGLVYVLTHECDLDEANERAFNSYALVCPIVCFKEFVEEFSEKSSEEELLKLIPDLAGNRVFRAIYLPAIDNDVLPFGGIVYLNQICSTHVETFRGGDARAVKALSSYAQRIT